MLVGLISVLILATVAAASAVLAPGVTTSVPILATMAGTVALGSAVWGLVAKRLERADQRHELMWSAVGSSSLTTNGRLPRVRDVQDPSWLGIRPAALGKSISSHLPSLQERVPSYVPRDVDEELTSILKRTNFILIVGDSAAGKSRTAFEIMSALFPKHRLIAPADQAALKKLEGVVLTQSRCVLWLDDLERYLGPGGLSRTLLASILGNSRTRRVVVATIRSIEMARLPSPSLRSTMRPCSL